MAASLFYIALTLLFTGLAGRKLYGENRGWAAAVILLGCVALRVGEGKRMEWDGYRTQVTDYEVNRYLPIL